MTVLGFNRDDGSRPAVQTEGGYRVVHLARPGVTGLAYFWRLKDALPWAATIPLAPFVLLLAPAIIAGERLGGALRGAVRRSNDAHSASRLRSLLRRGARAAGRAASSMS